MPPRNRVLAVVAVLGVVASIALIVYGMAESTPAQQLALELSALPLSVSLAAGDLILLGSGVRELSRRARQALVGGAAVSVLGLVLMVLAYLTGPRTMVQFGQFLVFVGLLVGLLVGMGLRGRGRTEWFHLEDAEDPADPEAAGLPGMVDTDR